MSRGGGPVEKPLTAAAARQEHRFDIRVHKYVFLASEAVSDRARWPAPCLKFGGASRRREPRVSNRFEWFLESLCSSRRSAARLSKRYYFSHSGAAGATWWRCPDVIATRRSNPTCSRSFCAPLPIALTQQASSKLAGQRQRQRAARSLRPHLVMLSKASRLLPSPLAASNRLSRAVAARGFAAQGDKVWRGAAAAPRLPARPLSC